MSVTTRTQLTALMKMMYSMRNKPMLNRKSRRWYFLMRDSQRYKDPRHDTLIDDGGWRMSERQMKAHTNFFGGCGFGEKTEASLKEYEDAFPHSWTQRNGPTRKPDGSPAWAKP